MLTNVAIVLILAVATYALARRVDVRLVLFASALLLGLLAGKPWVAFDSFRAMMSNGEVVGPICAALGYSFVLKRTGADRELVQLLMAPMRRAPWLLIPGGCLVGFVTNIAVVSQTAVVAALSLILIPLMRAAGYRPQIIAAALVLGGSGGDLLNPGDSEIVAIVSSTAKHGGKMQAVWNALVVPDVLGFMAATGAFWLFSRLWPAADPKLGDGTGSAEAVYPSQAGEPDDLVSEGGSINYLKAMLPPLPVAMLFATWPQFGLFPWLLKVYPDGLPVTHAIVISTIIAMLVSGANPSSETKAFFEGMGYGYAHVISLLIVATCFIDALKALGLIKQLVMLVGGSGATGKLAAGFFPWLLAFISGSGTAPSVGFSIAVLPEMSASDLPGAIDLGVMGAITSTYGRSMSPVAAVVVFTATLTGVPVMQVVRRTAPALAVGALVVLAIILGR